MRITFFIGNGFDLHVGLKSKYTHFYNELLLQNYESIIIRKIKNNPKEWSDFEMACGKELGNLKNEELNEFIKAFDEFKIKFSEYLTEQEKNIDYEQLNDEISTKTRDSINNFYSRTNLSRSQILKSKIDSIPEDVSFDFVIFNYTNTFEKVIEITKSKFSNLGYHSTRGNKYSHLIGECVKIHGSLSEDMIMGVNDESQIYDDLLKKDRRIKTIFIKPFLNDRLGKLRNEKVSQMIKRSKIICIYGMSLGESDNYWWEKILTWLKISPDNILIIFSYLKGENNNILSYQQILQEDEDTENFLNKIELDEIIKNKLASQIMFCYNSNLFDFKLIKETKDMQIEKTSVSV